MFDDNPNVHISTQGGHSQSVLLVVQRKFFELFEHEVSVKHSSHVLGRFVVDLEQQHPGTLVLQVLVSDGFVQVLSGLHSEHYFHLQDTVHLELLLLLWLNFRGFFLLPS